MGGKASAASKNKWNAKAYDRVALMVPKGRKADLQDHAAARGESLNGFINRAINDTMERDKGAKGRSIRLGNDAWEAIKSAANSRGEKPSEYVIRVISEALERDQ